VAPQSSKISSERSGSSLARKLGGSHRSDTASMKRKRFARRKVPLGLDGMIDAAGAGLDSAPPKLMLVRSWPSRPLRRAATQRTIAEVLSSPNNGMAASRAAPTTPATRTKPQSDHRHEGQLAVSVGVQRVPPMPPEIGRALESRCFTRTTTAGAFDQPGMRGRRNRRHLLGHQRLCRDRGMRRSHRAR